MECLLCVGCEFSLVENGRVARQPRCGRSTCAASWRHNAPFAVFRSRSFLVDVVIVVSLLTYLLSQKLFNPTPVSDIGRLDGATN